MREKIFYGWVIALASGVGLACGIATFVAATFPIFVGPIAREFGWSQGDAFNAPLVITLATALSAAWTGALVDRLGPRKVVLWAFVAEALIVGSFYFQGPSPWTFYLRYLLLGTLALGTTHIAFARLVSLWFDRRRGLALGVALTGVGFGGIALPIVSQLLIQSIGWRHAYLWLAGGLLVFTLPFLGLLVRDSPQSMGLTVDGLPASNHAASSATGGRTLHAAVRGGLFWWMLLAVLLIGIGIQSVMLHMKPLLETRGMSAMGSTYGQSAIFAGLVAGRLLAGWLMDRFFAPRVALGFLVSALAGIVLLESGASGALAYLAALLVGLSSGGEVDVIAYLTGRYYGLLQFSRIYSIFYALYSLGGGIGPRITASLVDQSGNYSSALVLDFGLLFVAGLMLLRFPAFPPPER
jgi:MFS family permease